MKNKVLGALALLMLSMTQSQCTSESGSNETGVSAASYSGPGSFYDIDFNEDSTFSLSIAESFGEDPLFDLTGTFETLSTGFLKLTVGEVTTSAGEGPEAGDEAYGLLIDGFGLFLKPLDSNEIIPMVISGSCPTADFSANWFIGQAGDTDEKDFSSDDQDAYGTFTYTHDTLEASVSDRFNLSLNESLGAGDAITDLNCDNGFMQIEVGEDDTANMWLTANGGAIVETLSSGERNSSIVALPAQEISSLADLEGEYAGLVFSGSQSEDNITPVTVTFGTDGTGLAEVYDNVETGTLTEESASLSLTGGLNEPSTGFITGDITLGSDTGHLACTLAAGLGGDSKSVISCMGQDPTDNTKPFLVLMVEK